MADTAPKRLGPYELGDFLGRGGMATVYRAYQRNMNRQVAIKLIATALAEDETFIARFEHEVKIAAQLEHPHILPVYDFGQEGQTAYLVMRLLEGGSLDQRLRKGSLKFSEIRRMIDQIGSALSYAHAHGVIHRDLKPSNVLLDEGQNAYLTDFGIAKTMDQTTGFTTTGQIVGTPSYLAPEQWSGEPATLQTDIYAFGVMLFQMLTGELPFKGDTPAVVMYKHLGTPPPAPNAIRPDIPLAMTDVINRVLAKNPADRYPKIDEFVDDVNNTLSGTPSSGSYPAPSVPTREGPAAKPSSGVRPAPTVASEALDNERTITDEVPLATEFLSKQRRGLGRFGTGAIILIVLLAAGFGAWRFV
ncbi:MAG TPA: serine/threonine-protein kinase, partial [Aggregatilineales bacterium]|nr:serine/threonine-protein kinase [Aggregatilineales bacterium]